MISGRKNTSAPCKPQSYSSQYKSLAAISPLYNESLRRKPKHISQIGEEVYILRANNSLSNKSIKHTFPSNIILQQGNPFRVVRHYMIN